MAWAAARTCRSRRCPGPAAGTKRRTPPRGRRRRSPLAVAREPSGCGALGRARLAEEIGVDLERIAVLVGDLEVGEDRVDRAGLDAGVAVDAHLRVDVELLRGLEIGRAHLRMYAVDRAGRDARVVLYAAAGDDVGHIGVKATYQRNSP